MGDIAIKKYVSVVMNKRKKINLSRNLFQSNLSLFFNLLDEEQYVLRVNTIRYTYTYKITLTLSVEITVGRELRLSLLHSTVLYTHHKILKKTFFLSSLLISKSGNKIHYINGNQDVRLKRLPNYNSRFTLMTLLGRVSKTGF